MSFALGSADLRQVPARYCRPSPTPTGTGGGSGCETSFRKLARYWPRSRSGKLLVASRADNAIRKLRAGSRGRDPSEPIIPDTELSTYRVGFIRRGAHTEKSATSSRSPRPTTLTMNRTPTRKLSPDQPRPAPCYSRHQFHFLSDSSPTLPPPASHQLASPRPTSRTDNTPLLPANQADNSTWPQAHR